MADPEPEPGPELGLASKQEVADVCAVCQEPLADEEADDGVAVLDCPAKHAFHPTCIAGWAEVRGALQPGLAPAMAFP